MRSVDEEAEPLRMGEPGDMSKFDVHMPAFVQLCSERLGVPNMRRLPRVRCYQLGLCFVSLVALGLLIAVIVLAVQQAMGMPIMHVMSVMRSIPTVQEWDTHRACLPDAKCDICALEPKMMMHPPGKSRVAVLAVRGNGGVLLEQYTQRATGLLTSVNDCWAAHALPLSWSGALFKSACAGEFFWSHAAFVRFFHWEPHPGYEPTHAIVVSRNPFDSIFSAWAFHIKCRDSADLWCVSRGVDDADFKDVTRWATFALERAKEWAALEAGAASTSLPLLRIDYKDLVEHRVPTMQRVVEFLSAAGIGPLPTVSQAVACAVADQSSKSKRPPGEVNVRQAFHDANLVEQVCQIVRPHWNRTRWGESCGVP